MIGEAFLQAERRIARKRAIAAIQRNCEFRPRSGIYLGLNAANLTKSPRGLYWVL